MHTRLALLATAAFSLAASACGGDRSHEPAAKQAATPQAEAPADSAQRAPADSTLWLVARGGGGEIMLVEGEMAPGTTLFPGDSTWTLEIVWHDAEARARPQLARVMGQTSRWAVAPGITLGTRLTELEAMNGGPFTLTGFSWDYGGIVTSWQGGKLASLRTASPNTLIRLAVPESPTATDAEYRDIAGDRELRSDAPLLRRLNPYVSEINVSYGTP